MKIREMTEDDELTIVYAGSQVDAALIKSLLEGDGIKAFLKDEVLGTIAPWYVAPAGVGAVKVVVLKRDLDRAMEVIKIFEEQD